MSNCITHCGYTWPQVVVITAIVCLGVAGAVLLDRWAAKHWKPTTVEEAADSVPIEPQETEWPDGRSDFWQRADPIPDDPTEVIVTGEVVEDHPTSVLADEPPLLERAEPLLDEALVQHPVDASTAQWWINGKTLHRASCWHVLRGNREQVAPVPSNNEELVRRWAHRQVLHLCGSCHPLPEKE